MPDELSHTSARLLALISTGKVIKLNKVVVANRMIPIHNNCGKELNSRIPPSNTQVMIEDEKFTTGTKALDRKSVV